MKLKRFLLFALTSVFNPSMYAQSIDTLCGKYVQEYYGLHGLNYNIILKPNLVFVLNTSQTIPGTAQEDSTSYIGHFVPEIYLGDLVLELVPDSVYEYSQDTPDAPLTLYESRKYTSRNVEDSFLFLNKKFVVGTYDNTPFLITTDTVHKRCYFRTFVNFYNWNRSMMYAYIRKTPFESEDNRIPQIPLHFNGATNSFIIEKQIVAKITGPINYSAKRTFSYDRENDSISYYEINKGYKDRVFVGMRLAHESPSAHDFSAYINVVEVFENIAVAEFITHKKYPNKEFPNGLPKGTIFTSSSSKKQ